LKERLKNR